MKGELFADEYHNLWLLLNHVRQAIFRVREKELFKHGITHEHTEALFCINVLDDEEVTSAKLARCLIREPHTVATLIERMRKGGLVKKVKDLPSKNMIRVEVTEEGKQVYEMAGKRESIHRIMSCLTKPEQRWLRRILEKLQDKAFDELGITERPLGPPPLGKLMAEYKSEVA